MSNTINFKRGGTFSYGCAFEMPAGTWSAACKLVDEDGNPVQTMTATLTPPNAPSVNHTLLIECPAPSTAAWPAKKLKGDVVFTDASPTPVVLPTSSFFVCVEESQST
jgi:hypothetical protein